MAEAESEMTHKNIQVALAAAQAEMGPVVKGATNPHFKSKYADLADVVEVVRPALNAHGVAFYHPLVTVDGERCVRTILAHGDSGTELTCDVPLIGVGTNMQSLKSAITYAKRIGLESLSGIAPEDDDGNAAVASPPRASKANSRGLYTALQGGLRSQKSAAALKEWGKNCADDIRKLPEDWADEIRREYAAEMEGFLAIENGDEGEQYAQQ